METPTPPKDAPLFIAILIGFLGFTAWTVGDALIRYINHYHPLQIGFMASVFTIFLLLLFAKPMGGMKASFQKPKQNLQILRGFVLSFSGLLSFFVFSNLDLATAYALIFCAPFFGKIASVILTGEQIRIRSWVITCVGFIGVLIVLRPGLTPMNIWALLAIVMAGFFAIGHVMGRFIGQENQTLFAQVFYNKIFNLAVMTLPMFWIFEPMPAIDIFITFCMGISGVLGGFMVSWAFSVAPTAYIAPIHYTQIILGSIWGILLFQEYPDFWTYIGGSIIIGAGLTLIYFGRQKELRNTPKK